MTTKGIIFEDFVNYRVPCMTIMMPNCDFKCDRECGMQVCQNCELAFAPEQQYNVSSIIEAYKENSITRAVCFQGLEPFDSIEDLRDFIFQFRRCFGINDDIVIYTGYKKYEISSYVEELKQFPNIVIKFGRYIPQDAPIFDEVLGVELASSNQYAERIS